MPPRHTVCPATPQTPFWNDLRAMTPQPKALTWPPNFPDPNLTVFNKTELLVEPKEPLPVSHFQVPQSSLRHPVYVLHCAMDQIGQVVLVLWLVGTTDNWILLSCKMVPLSTLQSSIHDLFLLCLLWWKSRRAQGIQKKVTWFEYSYHRLT